MSFQKINVGLLPNDFTGDPLRVAYIKINEMFEFDVYPVIPTVDQKAALAGTVGNPSNTNRYVTDEDPRNSNARIPTGAAGGDLTGTYPNPTLALKAVTLEKMADMPQNTIIGRIDPGTGIPQYLSAPNLKTILGITVIPLNFVELADTPANYTGHASKIVAVKADESGLEFVSSGATYTDENAQDAVGGILDNGTLGDINFTYTDATPTIHGVVKNSAITNAKLANVNTSTIKGRIDPGSGVVQDLTALQARTVIDVYSKSEVNTLLANLTFLGLTDTPSSYSTHANKLVAVNSGATGLEFITAAAGYTDEQAQDAIGTILDNGTNGDIIFAYNDAAPRIDASIKNSSVTYAKIQNVTGDRLLGREGSAGVVQEIQLGSGLSLAGGVLSSTGGAGSSTFLGLTDTPSSYTGHGGKFVAVNATPDGLEFRVLVEADIPSLSAYYLASNPSNFISANQTITLTGAVTGSGTTSIATTLANSIVTNPKLRNSTGLSVIGRSASSTGEVADITALNDYEVLRRSGSVLEFGLVHESGISLANGTILVGTSGDIAVARTVSGDITLSAIGAATIINDAVTFAKLQNISTSRILGRVSASAGDVEELTGTQVTGLLDVFGTAVKGLVPAGEGGNTKFLREDGTWQVPSGGGGGTITGSGAAGQVTYWSGATAITGKSTFTFDATNDILKAPRFNTSLAAAPVGGVTNGDFYYNSTAFDFMTRINGHWVNLTRIPERVDPGTLITLTEADRNTKIRCSSNDPVTVVLPLLSTNFTCTIVKSGLGNVTFSTDGNWVGVSNVIQVQHGAVTVYHSGGNTWRLYGTLGLNGGGTVTSVGLNPIAGLINISGSPVTLSGNITMSLATQAPNTFFRGPASGIASQVPFFGSIVVADLPNYPIEPEPGLTYIFKKEDNHKVKVFTNAGGCATTIPLLLPEGWSTLAYRPLTGGGVTFSSDGVMEPTVASLSTPGTMASILHRGGNIHVVSGAIGSAGGVDLVNGNATIISGNTVNLGGSLTGHTTVNGQDFVLNWGTTGSKLSQFTVNASNLINIVSDLGTTINGPAGYFHDAVSGRRIGIVSNGISLNIGSDAGGDIYYRTGGGLLTRLPIGSDNQVLKASLGLPIWADPSNGSVTTVSGVADRITVTDPSTTPLIDIASTYAGQPSITTVGTITSGVWNGTAVDVTHGGTGLTSLGAANRILAVNNAGTSLEYKTISTSTSPVAGIGGNIGVTLDGPNAIVINIPDASLLIRGALSANAQTIGGVKTFAQVPVITPAANGGIFYSSSGAVTAITSFTFSPSNRTININGAGNGFNGYIIDNTDTSGDAVAFGLKMTGQGYITEITNAGVGHATDPNVLRLTTGAGNGILLRTTVASSPIKFFTNSTERVRISDAGVGIFQTSPSAKLHIAGGTSAAGSGPLKIGASTGTGVTAAEDGLFEYYGSHLYFTIGSTKYQLDQQGGGGGTGTVTNFTALNLSPLFTTSVNNGSTTPELVFALSNAAANTYFGNASGVSAAPSYTAMAALTKNDTDTNLKIELTGTPSSSLLKAVEIVTSWSGALSGVRGGTGQTTTAVGDLLIGAASNTWSKLATVATGSVLLSGTTPSWGKLPITTIANISSARILGRVDAFTGIVQELTGTQATTLLDVFSTSAKGLVPVASGGNETTQFLRKDGSWAVPTGSSITNGAANTELAMSDGTNLDPSGIFIPSSGSLTLGSSSIAGGRGITVASSDANAGLAINPLGNGGINLNVNGVGVVQIGSDNVAGARRMTTGSSDANANLSIDSKGTGALILNALTSGAIQIGDLASTTKSSLVITSALNAHSVKFTANNGRTGAVHGTDIHIVAGNAASGGRGGNICLQGGSDSSSEGGGNVALFGVNNQDISAGFDGATGVLAIANVTTEPSGNTGYGLYMYSAPVAGGSNRTLGLQISQAVEAIGTFTPSHKLKVKINGQEFWMQLDAV